MIRRTIITLLILFIGSAATIEYYGIRINQTNSMPGLLWQSSKTKPSGPPVGTTVFICPPETSVFALARERKYMPFGITCPGFSTPLLKPVAATAGDVVDLTSDKKITINGYLQPNSTIHETDSLSRPMPQLNTFPLVVPAGQLFLLSTYNHRSFDSRYFGPLPTENVTGLAQPFFGNPSAQPIRLP